MATFVIRAWSLKLWGSAEAFRTNSPPSTTPYFTDVPNDQAYNPDSYFPYVQKMWELGITSGCAAGSFCPAETIPNWQTAIFVVRARQLMDGNCSYNCINNNFVDYSGTPYFYDVPTYDGNFKWIQKLADLGGASPELSYLNCSGPGYFCANSSTGRGSKAMFLVFGGLGLIPNAESVTPGYGSIVEGTFQTIVSNPLGGSDIESVTLSFEGSDNYPCAVTYDSASGLYLSTAGGGQTGPVSLGQSTVLDNGYCQVDAGLSNSYISGLNRIVNLAMSFSPFSFTGNRNIWLFAKNKGKAKAVKKQKGSVQVPGGSNPSCQVPIE